MGEMREENLMPEIKDFSSSFSVPRAGRGRGEVAARAEEGE